MGNDLLAFLVMVIVQLGFAGMIIITKLVMDSGMDPFVQSAYKPIFATISIAPFAYFLERYVHLFFQNNILRIERVGLRGGFHKGGRDFEPL